MTREQAQAFVNQIEREVMVCVEQSDVLDMDDLDEALIELDQAMMKIMDIIAEDA